MLQPRKGKGPDAIHGDSPGLLEKAPAEKGYDFVALTERVMKNHKSLANLERTNSGIVT